MALYNECSGRPKDDRDQQDQGQDQEPELIDIRELPEPELEIPTPGRDFPILPEENTDVDDGIDTTRGKIIVPDVGPIDPKTGKPLGIDPDLLEELADEFGASTYVPLSELLN